MLAVAFFEFNLYEDVDGQPGERIVSETVAAGDTFFLEITAEEQNPFWSGFGSVAVDVQWDPAALRSIDADLSQSVTPQLPLFAGGELDNGAGRIDDLRGMAFLSSGIGRVIGNNRPERFALLHFEAVAAADSTEVRMWQGRSRIGTVPVSSLRSANLDFEVQTISVVSALPVDIAEPAATPVVAAPTTDNTVLPPPVAPGDGAPLPPPIAPPIASPVFTHDVGLSIALVDESGREVDEIQVGDVVFAQIDAIDLRDDALGVGGLSVDVHWNAASLEFSGEFDPNDLLTADFPMFRTGQLDAAAGRIEDLGGASFRATGAGQPIGAEGSERFARIPFRALAPIAASEVAISLREGGIGLVGATGAPRVTIDNAALAVKEAIRVAPVAPPRIEVAGSSSSSSDIATIQFSTSLRDGASPLVRSALPDRRQFVDVENSSAAPLLIFEIEVHAPQVQVIAAPQTIAPGATERIQLAFAPLSNAPPLSFDQLDGLVIRSNAENAPELPIRLVGASTFDGDINYDGRVSIADLTLLSDHFGTEQSQAGYSSAFDPNGDGAIDPGDFGPLNAQFGQSLPKTPTILAPTAADRVDAAFAEGEWGAPIVDEVVVAKIAETWLDFADYGHDEEDDEPQTDWTPVFESVE